MKNNQITDPVATLEVMPPVPPEFRGHNKDMKPQALQAAITIGEKHPEIVKAALEFHEAYGRAGEKFFGMASTLRAAKLVGKEATLLMLGLGFSKSRASEMLRLSSVSDEIWAKYSAKTVGFRAALALDNGTETESSTGGTTETGAENERQSNIVKAVPAPLSEEIKAGLSTLLKSIKRPLKGGKPTDYDAEFYIDSVKFVVIIQASKKS